MTRGVSSQLSTDNFQSNTVLPAVNEYGPGDTSERKPTMFDPIPAENTGKKIGLAESNSQVVSGGPEANHSSIQQEILAQESDRQLSFADDTQNFSNQDAVNNQTTFQMTTNRTGTDDKSTPEDRAAAISLAA